MLNSFRKIVSSNSEVQRVQENTALVFKQVLAKEILDGLMITATVTSSNTTVAHLLGRQPLGWIVVDRGAATGGTEGNIVRVSWDERSIVLKSTGTGSVNLTLWVF